MQSYTIVGYAYDADLHCVDCARKAFSQDDLDNLSVRHMEEWGGTLDTDPQPYFADEAIDQSEPDHCGDCGAKLLD